jgi:copper ion binding protein
MYELQVEGMSCNHCVGAVTKSVLGADANAKVDVDLKSGLVRVESKQDIDAIKEAVADAGYEVNAARTL